MRRLQRQIGAGLSVIIVAVLGALAVRAQKPIAEWRYYGGDKAFTRYSPLAQITRDNVKNLKIAWRRPAVDSSLTQAFPGLRVSAFLKVTPIVIDGVLYTPNAHGLITAFDGATGATKWEQEPFARTAVQGPRETQGTDILVGHLRERAEMLFVERTPTHHGCARHGITIGD